MPMETYVLYLAAVAVFFATPPDTSQLLIISNSVRHGLRRSVYTIAGDLTANGLQMTGAAFGLAAIIATSASAFIWIKWFGVAYLVWIGAQLMLSKDQPDDVTANASGSSFRLFRLGFITSMANPFAVVFFGALNPLCGPVEGQRDRFKGFENRPEWLGVFGQSRAVTARQDACAE